MEKSLFKFIWKYSKREQIIQLLITLLTFPVLFASLELPKRIINDGIGGTGENTVVLGFEFNQIEFLMLLCAGFFLAVVTNLLFKMRLNTMKGVLSERLLRRFRYQLLTRVMRFPRSYFRNTSQGELVSMVTSEAEPMGGLMGDILSLPVSPDRSDAHNFDLSFRSELLVWAGRYCLDSIASLDHSQVATQN